MIVRPILGLFSVPAPSHQCPKQRSAGFFFGAKTNLRQDSGQILPF
jgi:hypothetical protein